MKARLAVLLVAALVAVGAAVALASALGWRQSSSEGPRSGVAADTARFTYGSRSVEVPLLECGREGDSVVMAGRRGDTVVQVGADLGEGGAARTGVTADLGGEGTLGAFGADMPQGLSGELARVEALGDSLVVEGRWARLDPDTFVPVPGAPPVDGRLVARCPEPSPAD